jgi:dephospho-CoA kinase
MAFKRLGIAGYMGAGKSTAARLLAPAAGQGMQVIIDADKEAKSFMTADPAVRDKLVAEFGGSIIDKNGLSFSALGLIVFSSHENLLKLNAIVHPPFVQHLRGLLQQCRSHPVVLDAALLPLWRIESLFDTCLWIHAPFKTRLDRLLQSRSGLDKSSLVNRMRRQEEILRIPEGLPWITVENSVSVERLAETLGTLCL